MNRDILVPPEGRCCGRIWVSSLSSLALWLSSKGFFSFLVSLENKHNAWFYLGSLNSCNKEACQIMLTTLNFC